MLSRSRTWCAGRVMYSSEAETRERRREAERREQEELALKKEDVRKRVRKYDRLRGKSKVKVRKDGPLEC